MNRQEEYYHTAERSDSSEFWPDENCHPEFPPQRHGAMPRRSLVNVLKRRFVASNPAANPATIAPCAARAAFSCHLRFPLALITEILGWLPAAIIQQTLSQYVLLKKNSFMTCSLNSRVNVRRLSTAVLAATAPFLVSVKPPPGLGICA